MSTDPTIPTPHEHSKEDVEVWVPMIRQYGIVHPGGAQTLYQSVPHAEGGASIRVHPDHLNRVLRAIEGSRLLKLPTIPDERASQEPNDRMSGRRASLATVGEDGPELLVPASEPPRKSTKKAARKK